MYFDPTRNAYIDSDTGAVVLQETDPQLSLNTYQPVSSMSPPSYVEKLPYMPSRGTIAAPTGVTVTPPGSPSGYLSVPIDTPARNGSLTLEQIYYSQGTGDVELQQALQMTAVNAQTAHSSAGYHFFDDWTLARTLQSLEFEFTNEEIAAQAIEGDFNAKEYKASRSCRRQLMTFSFVICLIQIGELVAMIQLAGYDKQNPVIGPPVYIMVRFGAKETALIVDLNEWWRLVTPIFIHAGMFHIIPNVAVQLRVGGYLELIYGRYNWLLIYFLSGIFGVMMSCIFLPDTVGVGSSGALMGLLSSWIVWIIFRWKKIPHRMKGQRNCQLVVVVLSVVVTLATSYTPNVDWAAHAGGALQGLLWGIVLLSHELDHQGNQLMLRVFAGVTAVVLLVFSLCYMIFILTPSKQNLEYWEENDNWG